MEYINKNNASNYYDTYTNLENEAWSTVDSRYFGYDYDNLKTKLKPLLKTDQNSICCYCMATLENSSTTLEHIFPQNPSVTDCLRTYGINCIVRTDEFNQTRTIPNPILTNLPHDISYYNLIASCDSKVSCNNKRGNKKIETFFFIPTIKDQFNYDQDGNISAINYESDIATLGLANNDLTKYRKLWKHMFSKGITLSTIPSDLKKQVITSALELGLNDNYFMDFIENNKKIKWALRYSYFFS